MQTIRISATIAGSPALSMKRSTALAPLSRDHHSALVVARELSRASAAQQAEAAARRFMSFLGEHELGHFALEERVLLPVVPAKAPGPQLARRLLDDHRWLRDSLRRLREPAAARDLDLVHEVGRRLREHVRMEEQELFPFLEGCLDTVTLERIGAELAA